MTETQSKQIGGPGSLARVRALALALLLCHVEEPVLAREPDAAVFSDPRLIKIGDKLFARNCSRGYCHGKDGRAGKGPRFRGRTLEKSYMFKATRSGVPGTSMAPWEGRLSDAEIWSIVAFLSSLSSVDPQGEPLTTAPISPAVEGDLSAIDLAELVGESSDAQFGGSIDAGSGGDGKEVNGDKLETTPGDPERGRELFFDISAKANCGGCHRVEGKGGAVGPDLISVSRRPAKAILRDILVPDASVSEEWQLQAMTTRSGAQLQVVLAGESATRIKIHDLTGLPPVLRSIKKDDVLGLEPLGRSAMPDDFSEHYTTRELLDIIAFIKSFDSGSTRPVRLGDFF